MEYEILRGLSQTNAPKLVFFVKLHSHSDTSSTSNLKDEYSDPEEGQSSEQQVLTWLINSPAQNPQNKRPGVVPAVSHVLCRVPHTFLEVSLPCPVCGVRWWLSCQHSATKPCPTPASPGPAGPACLTSAIPGLWERGGRQQGVEAHRPGSPWCSLIKHTATSCAGLSVPLGGGKGQGTVAVSSRAGKSPWRQAHVWFVQRKMCALVSFFHRVAMEPGHRAAPQFQLQERSAGGAASASQSRCWLWSMDSADFWGLSPMGLLPCLPPGEGHHLHHTQIPESGQQRLAVLTEGASTLEFPCLPPGLTELTSAVLHDTASSSGCFFFFMPFVLPVKNCRFQSALYKGLVGRQNRLCLVSGKESNCTIRFVYAPEAYGGFFRDK